MEGLSRKEKGFMDTDNSVVTVGVGGGVRGLNGNGEKSNKNFQNLKKRNRKEKIESYGAHLNDLIQAARCTPPGTAAGGAGTAPCSPKRAAVFCQGPRRPRGK